MDETGWEQLKAAAVEVMGRAYAPYSKYPVGAAARVDDGRTVVRAAYGWSVDQPGTTAVNGTTGNPPFATPLTATGAVSLGSAVSQTQVMNLSPVTVDPAFRNASLR